MVSDGDLSQSKISHMQLENKPISSESLFYSRVLLPMIIKYSNIKKTDPDERYLKKLTVMLAASAARMGSSDREDNLRQIQSTRNESLQLPYAQIQIHLETEMSPLLIRNAADSHVAMIKEPTPPPESQSPEEFYGQQCDCKVISSRILSAPEMKWMELETDVPIRLLEFRNSAEREEASELFDFVDKIFDNSIIYDKKGFLGAEMTSKMPEEAIRNLMSSSSKEISEWKFIPSVTKDSVGCSGDVVETLAPSELLKSHENLELVPLFRKSLVIHRDVRGALNDVIHCFDASLRELGGNRLFEEWRDQDEIGILGVEGKDVVEVNAQFARLEDILAPEVFPVAPELLFGSGESFVRGVAERFKLLIDVDKFQGAIRVFGDEATRRAAVEEMKQFAKVKDHLEIRVDVPTGLPFLEQLFLSHEMGLVETHLGAELRVNGSTIEFRGSVKAYDALICMLWKISCKANKYPTDCCICGNRDAQEDFLRHSCGQAMCRDCCNRKVRSVLKNSERLFKTPPVCCLEKWSPNDLLRVIVGDSRRVKALDGEKLKQFRTTAMWSIAMKDEHAVCCPAVDCPGVLIREIGKRRIPCAIANCSFFFCGDCLGAEHGELACGEATRLSEDQSLEEYLREKRGEKEKVMKCPRCKSMVEKTTGCNHMECFCGQHFCWKCGKAVANLGECNTHLLMDHGGIFEDQYGTTMRSPPWY